MSSEQPATLGDLESRKRFDPAEVEPRITRAWLDSGLFHPEPLGTPEENYSIAIPPPNVTGALHMGHALNGSIQDTLVRHHRMRGRRTKWILGTDHAGIATQTQVEKQLRGEGSSREELGRDAFLERVWAWREQYGSTIIEQFKRLGASCDFDDERFTLDDGYVEAVLRVFVELYEQGLIYRDEYMVNWDPGSRSAISDLEVENREVTDTLYEIAYPLADGDGEIVVATVRPETMLADTAVAVNPSDERFAHLIGREAVLPLSGGRRLPIIGDDYVKTDFGTGALKITPGHDPNDFEIGRRHGLQELTAIGEDGRMTELAGEFAGLTVEEAQPKVIEALERDGLLRRTEPYTHEVPFSHRSGRRIEPLISLQWFMRMDELAKAAADAVESGDVRITPEGQRRRYLAWLADIRPWCISRQLWWGHRLPVYYCEACGETHVAAQEPDACAACGGSLRRDEDVLDTWFSSALWPFATLGWPNDTEELAAFYPTDVLVTARDIVFLWVARMVMMGLRFTGRAPFRDVYVHSVIQAPDGRRMSSTQDVRYSPEKIRQGQALAQKLWSAARLLLLSVDAGTPPAAHTRTLEDRWILSRLARAEREIAENVEGYDFAHAAQALYAFVFDELCDWYLELIKPRLAQEPEAIAPLALHVLRRTLMLAHPLIPFVTEEIWAQLGEEGLLAGQAVEPPEDSHLDNGAEEALQRAIDAIKEVRSWRSGVGVAPRHPLVGRLTAEGYDAEALALLERMAALTLGGDSDPIAAIAVPGGTLELLAESDVDLSAQDERAQKKREQLQADVDRARGKLANEDFVARAPDAVVAAEREKLARLEAELETL
jgi:valyl-tRNA synthetase